MDKDLYEILGVNKNATEQEIKRAYRRKARELHPDVSKVENAEEKFKELNEAYDVLSDPNKRTQYDRFGTIPGAASGSSPFGGVDFGDMFGGFGDIFSSFFNTDPSQGNIPKEGRDMAIGLRLTLNEVATGIKKEIVYDRLASCDECNGSGLGENGKKETCSKCGGKGQVFSVQQTMFGRMQTASECPQCHGQGKTITNPCKECNGQGRVPDRQRVSVEVPAGINTGQQLRVNGFGEAGIQGSKSGDLIVTCKVLPHEYFERDGDNLLARISISYLQAILGDTIEIDGIFEGEKIKIKIPKGTQNGDVLTSKKCGMPRLHNSSSRGNLYSEVHISIPKRISKQEKDALERLWELKDNKHKSPLQKLREAVRG